MRSKCIEEVDAAVDKERLFECTQCRENIAKYTVNARLGNQVVGWGQLFKDRREDKDLTQRDVAEISGVVSSTICRLERGDQPLFETTLRAHNAVGAEIFSLPDHLIPAVGNLLAKVGKAD